MPTGSVKWFDPVKGYGYITPEGGGQDAFVHRAALPPEVSTLTEGQIVDYETEPTPRGPKVTQLRVK
ncbi:MAG TPA: cold-shock protein [Phycisphaerae bacterium]|nr:cold-shock protein [Phycisphaerae bacterium]HOJ72433.1 cold-shock protein [Phycisphaerae bacterium]HOM49905.1 cold-shock protein [Phycisphaerae bacterium]HON66187.1 cold-shock protein [Phycisphaerae bacterium]HOQ87532.1 cold-shock protein [Phycisphaerae bacterium]